MKKETPTARHCEAAAGGRSNLFYGVLVTVFLVPLVFCTWTTEIFGLSKVVFMSFFSGLLMLAWLSDMVLKGELVFKRNKTVFLALGYIFYIALSLLWAESRWIGVYDLVKHLSFFFIFLLIVNFIKTKQDLLLIIKTLVIAGVLACLVDFRVNDGFSVYADRMDHIATFGHPNFFAQYLILVIPLAAGLVVLAKRRVLFLAWIGVTAIMLVYLLSTRCRASWLGMVVAVLALLVILLFVVRLKKLMFSVCVALLIMASLFILPGRARNLLYLSRDRIAQAISDPTHATGKIRILLWKETLVMVKDYPIFGTGVGNFKVKLPPYRTKLEKNYAGKGLGFSKAHNEYLQIWVESGIIGLGLFLTILFLTLRALKRIIFKGNHEEKVLASVILLSVVSAMAHGFFSSNFQIPAAGFSFWVIVGLVHSLALSGADKKVVFRVKKPVFRILSAGILIVLFLTFYLTRVAAGDYYHYRLKEARKAGDVDAALKYGNLSMRWNMTDPKACFSIGVVNYQAGYLEGAETNYRWALKSYPNHDIIWNNLGALYIKMNRLADARVALERALQINPDNQDAQRNLGLL